jgi:hypothetical protein
MLRTTYSSLPINPIYIRNPVSTGSLNHPRNPDIPCYPKQSIRTLRNLVDIFKDVAAKFEWNGGVKDHKSESHCTVDSVSQCSNVQILP